MVVREPKFKSKLRTDNLFNSFIGNTNMYTLYSLAESSGEVVVEILLGFFLSFCQTVCRQFLCRANVVAINGCT